jgi:hypothetical protein
MTEGTGGSGRREKAQGRGGRRRGGTKARRPKAAPRRGPSAGRTDARGAEQERGVADFGPVNYALLGAALVSIVIGYVLLDRGSITAAPLLLVLGYVVLIPAGLLIGSRTSEE